MRTKPHIWDTYKEVVIAFLKILIYLVRLNKTKRTPSTEAKNDAE